MVWGRALISRGWPVGPALPFRSWSVVPRDGARPAASLALSDLVGLLCVHKSGSGSLVSCFIGLFVPVSGPHCLVTLYKLIAHILLWPFSNCSDCTDDSLFKINYMTGLSNLMENPAYNFDRLCILFIDYFGVNYLSVHEHGISPLFRSFTMAFQ